MKQLVSAGRLGSLGGCVLLGVLVGTALATLGRAAGETHGEALCSAESPHARLLDLAFRAVYFAENSAAIRVKCPECPGGVTEPILAGNVSQMLLRPDIHLLVVQGHADPREDSPEALALERAQALYALLRERGIPADRLEIRSLGTSKLAFPESDSLMASFNRRVEFEPYRCDVSATP